MDNLHYEQAKGIFLAVCDLPPEQHREKLDEACGGNRELRTEVESLLQHHDPTATIVQSPDEQRPRIEEPLPYEQIGRYRVLRELGRGGMGVVLLGEREDERFKRRVAIKLLKRGMDTEEVLRRFQTERRVLAALTHPGIARLYDAGETEDGLPYFVMEHIDGMELGAYCDSHRLSIEARLELFRKICAAVHYAHQNLIVHRDLKPGNILVTEDGQPKLLDFGIAKLTNPELAQAHGQTAPGFRVMTPEYASPEQVRGLPISTASDVYSLGVILYELVCGHSPYRIESRSQAEIERLVCVEEPDKPSTAFSRVEEIDAHDPTTGTITLTPESIGRTRECRPQRLRRSLSGDIDNIVMMAMRKEPQRRYRSAEELAEDIRRHQNRLPVIARRDTFGYRSAKFIRRHRGGVAAAAMLGVSLTGGLAGTAWGWSEANDARAAEMNQRVEAEHERDRADRRFEEGRALARTFMFDFHDSIQSLDGSIPARELLVTTALEYLDGLSKEAGDSVELRRELADAYTRVGDIRGGTRNPSLGDVDGAYENYRTAMAIRETLASELPYDQEIRREVSTSHMRIGDMLQLKGDLDGTVQAYEASLAIREALAEADPDDRRRRRDVAVALGNVGKALVAGGETESALEHYERSLKIRRALLDEQPDDTRARRDVSVMCLRVAGRHEKAGRLEVALAHYEEAAAIRERLVESDPSSARWRRDLALARQFVARTLMALDDVEGALEIYERNAAMLTRRAIDNPLDARTKRDLAWAWESIGQAQRRLGRTTDAMSSFDTFRSMSAALAEAHPENVQYHRLVAVADEQIGEVHADAGRLVAAVERGRTALATYARLAETDPDDARARADVARIRQALGTWLQADGQRAAALRELEQARASYERLLELVPDDAESRAAMVETLLALARLVIDLGDGSEATAHLERAIFWLGGEPTPVLLADLAAARRLAGDDAGARKAAKEALRLLDDDPSADDGALRRRLGSFD